MNRRDFLHLFGAQFALMLPMARPTIADYFGPWQEFAGQIAFDFEERDHGHTLAITGQLANRRHAFMLPGWKGLNLDQQNYAKAWGRIAVVNRFRQDVGALA